MTQTATVPAGAVRLHVWGLAAAYGIGLVLAVQSRVNGELGHRIGDGVLAGLISLMSGGVLLALACLLVPGVRAGVGNVWRAVRAPAGAGARPAPVRLRWWQCIGGLAGAAVVTGQATAVALIGVAVFTVALVAGQAASSLVVDRLGIGPAGPRPVTWARVVGAVLAMAAVVVAVSERLGDPSVLVLAVLPAVAGVATAAQVALNGRVALTASPDGYGAVAAAVVNFSVAMGALVLVLAVDLLVRGMPRALPAEPWLYLGGALGAVFITVAAAIVRVVGVLVLGLAAIAGQLSGGLVLDLAVPAAHPVTVSVIAGTTLALLAMIVASRR